MKKESKKRMKRSEIIPKYGSLRREQLINTLHSNKDYKNNIKKGLPFYTEEQLGKIKDKYADGITWSEIDTELSKKGVIMKKATFRSYIQNQNISSSVGFKKNKKGREAIYPSDTIEHINFIQYFYRMADDDFIFNLISFIESLEVSAMDLIQDNLTEYSFFTTLIYNLVDNVFGADDLEETFRHVLKDHPDFLEKLLPVYNELLENFNTKYDQLMEMLENYKILP